MVRFIKKKKMASFNILYISGALFFIGTLVVLTRKNAILILMGIELMLNASILNFIAFDSTHKGISGGLMALFILVVAAAEVTLALAILLGIYKRYGSTNPDAITRLGA